MLPYPFFNTPQSDPIEKRTILYLFKLDLKSYYDWVSRKNVFFIYIGIGGVKKQYDTYIES